MPRAKTSTTHSATSKKTSRKEETVELAEHPRQLKLARHKSFRISKPIKRIEKPHKLPSAPQLFWRSCQMLARHWKLFGGILLVYAVLTIILVGGVGSSSDLSLAKSNIAGLFTGQYHQLSAGFTLLVFLVSNAGQSASGGVASAYQSVLLLVVSLVLIWTFRQRYAGNKIRVRDAFYQGLYPLVPFVLVLLVVGLQLIPLVLGGALYTTLFGSQIVVYPIEKALSIVLSISLATLSLYMLCSSLFALYIVTLPDMTPMKALRSARELVRYRRWPVLRKILFLAFVLLSLAVLIMVPVALYVTSVAYIFYFILTILGLAVIHSYMYAVYRELLT